ncbi:hypothetical protein ABPG72_005845 [Tetrahymena utriculariae]
MTAIFYIGTLPQQECLEQQLKSQNRIFYHIEPDEDQAKQEQQKIKRKFSYQPSMSDEGAEKKANNKMKKKRAQFRYVNCGQDFAVVLDKNGQAWSFGAGINGQLGIDEKIRIQLKLKALNQLKQKINFQNVSCGQKNVLAVDENGKLYCWGNISQYKCGVSVKQNQEEQLTPLCITDEVMIKAKLANKKRQSRIFSQMSFQSALVLSQQKQLLNDLLYDYPKVSLVSTGMNFSYCGVLENKHIVCFGLNQNNKMGIGMKEKEIIEPQIVPFFNTIKVQGISCGKDHCAAWDNQGQVYTWGDPQYGKLGHPYQQGLMRQEIQKTPKKVEYLKEEFIIQVCCTFKETVALTRDGYLYTWGKGNASDKFVNQREKKTKSQNQEEYRPVLFDIKIQNQDVNFIKISGKYSHFAAIDKFGRLFTWGNNTSECLGHPDLRKILKQNEFYIFDVQEPKLVEQFANKFVIDVDCGLNFTTVVCASKKQFKLTESIFYQRYIQFIQSELKNQVDLIKQYSKRKAALQNSLERKGSLSSRNRSSVFSPRISNKPETPKSQLAKYNNSQQKFNYSNDQIEKSSNAPTGFQVNNDPQNNIASIDKRNSSIHQFSELNFQDAIKNIESQQGSQQEARFSVYSLLPQQDVASSTTIQNPIVNNNQNEKKAQVLINHLQNQKNNYYFGSKNKMSFGSQYIYSSSNIQSLTSRHKNLINLQINKSAHEIYKQPQKDHFGRDKKTKFNLMMQQIEEVKTVETTQKQSKSQTKAGTYNDIGATGVQQSITLKKQDLKDDNKQKSIHKNVLQISLDSKEQEVSTARKTSFNMNDTGQIEQFGIKKTEENNMPNSQRSINKSFEQTMNQFYEQNQNEKNDQENILEKNLDQRQQNKTSIKQMYQMSKNRISSLYSTRSYAEKKEDSEEQDLQDYLSKCKWKTDEERDYQIKKFKEIQHQKRIKEELQKQSRQYKKNLISNISHEIQINEIDEEQGFLASYNFDQISDLIIQKEQKDPNYFPLNKNDTISSMLSQQNKNSLDYLSLQKLQKSQVSIEAQRKFKKLFQKISQQYVEDSELSQQLQKEAELYSNDKEKLRQILLKKEYLDIIEKNQEQEHMVYLLSDPLNPKQNKTLNSQFYSQTTRNFNDSQKKFSFEQTTKIRSITKQEYKKVDQDQLQNEIYKQNQNFKKECMIKFPDYCQQLKTIKKTQKNGEQAIKIHKDIDKILHDMSLKKKPILSKEQKLQKLQENSQTLKEKTLKAILTSENILRQKISKYQEQLDKRRKSFFEILQQKQELNKQKQLKKKNLITLLAAEQILNFFGDLKYYALEKKKNMFRKHLCATQIQRYFRNYILNKKTISNMSKKVKLFFQRVILRFITKRNSSKKREACSLICRHFLVQKIQKITKLKIAFLLNQIRNIQRFILWCQHQQLSQIRIYSDKWDHYLTSTFKFQENEVSRMIKQQFKLGEQCSFEVSKMSGEEAQLNAQLSSLLQASSFDFKQFKQNKSIQKLLNIGINEAKQFTQNNLKIIPNIMSITNDYGNSMYIDPDQLKSVNDQTSTSRQKSILNANKSSISFTQQLAQSLVQSNSEILLPFTLHRDLFVLPPNFKVKYGNEEIHQKIYQKAIKLELDLKIKFIKQHIKKQIKEFYGKLKVYKTNLEQFVLQNKKIVNLQRTELMIKANKEQLSKLQKREEIQYTQRIQRIKMKRPMTRDKELFIKDHLPFGSIVSQIAANMPEAPTRPKFKYSLTIKQFEEYFKCYYSEFVKKYSQLCLDERIKSHQYNNNNNKFNKEL